MIHRITIKNFKSLYSITTELKPLTIIIGPNACGKSNFLDALEAVRDLVRYKGTVRAGRDGEVPTIPAEKELWRRAGPSEEIFWETDYRSGHPSEYENFVYTLAIRHTDDIPVVSRERLTADNPKKSGNHEYFRRNGTDITVCQPAGKPDKTDISPADLALHAYARQSFPAVSFLRDFIAEWQFHKIIPQCIRSYRRSSRGRKPRLSEYGGNLAAVLHYLRREKPEDFEYIQDEMSAALHLSRLHTREEDEKGITSHGQRKICYLKAGENVFADLKPFGPDNLSDGTLGLLALLTVLGVSEPAPLTCLEEPERSIHPQLTRRLANYLHEASRHTQLIVTTHSPEFLDHFNPYEQDYVQVLVACRDSRGATRFVPVRDIRNVRAWLDDYMLGQIWAMGQIEEIF